MKHAGRYLILSIHNNSVTTPTTRLDYSLLSDRYRITGLDKAGSVSHSPAFHAVHQCPYDMFTNEKECARACYNKYSSVSFVDDSVYVNEVLNRI